jgi:glycosyltransferase involved in cell wall biosynthesis
MKEILIFSKYFGYAVGGAEKSVFELLKQKEKEGYKITVLYVENVKTFSAQKLKMCLPLTWKIDSIKFRSDSIRFYYFHYFFNKSVIENAIKQYSPDKYILYSYGLYAPAAINVFSGETIYLIRDEYGLGWNNNYFKGIKKVLKDTYRLMDYFFYKSWQKELLQCMKKSHVLANSKFIANEVKKLVGKQAEVIYPYVDIVKLRREFEEVKNENVQKGIVMVGDNIIKGSDIFKRIARYFPEEIFYLFDRKYEQPMRDRNIVYMPWQKRSVDIYKYAKVVLIPSRCYEAFSRVALEARALGIPLVGSMRGGIPEAVGDAKECLVKNIENYSDWIKKLKLYVD